jgi:hypothetical protein
MRRSRQSCSGRHDCAKLAIELPAAELLDLMRGLKLLARSTQTLRPDHYEVSGQMNA